jgi:hypothetical protein
VLLHVRVSTSDIKESAGWEKTHAVLSYLTGPVPSTISVVAGHAKNTYIMRRDRVPIPPELEALVFPWAPVELKRMTEVRSIKKFQILKL